MELIITKIAILVVVQILILQDCMRYINLMIKLDIAAYIFQGLVRCFRRSVSMEKAISEKDVHSAVKVELYSDYWRFSIFCNRDVRALSCLVMTLFLHSVVTALT